jgi:hypothetical protein
LSYVVLLEVASRTIPSALSRCKPQFVIAYEVVYDFGGLTTNDYGYYNVPHLAALIYSWQWNDACYAAMIDVFGIGVGVTVLAVATAGTGVIVASTIGLSLSSGAAGFDIGSNYIKVS